MNAQNITFSANEQVLTKTDDLLDFASNTVSYIEATFTLGTNWTGFDSVRAVWKSDYHTIATVLDANHKCVVPSEILMYRSKVYVNLVGSIAENNVLTDRLTTFPVQALVVTQNAEVDGSETAPITASQFEQFVDTVRDEAGAISDYSYDSEAWAVGTRGGVDVPSTDETYHNNSKYWAEQNAGLSDEVADLSDDVADLKEDIEQLNDDVDSIESNVGNLTNLETTDKSSIVNAVNELEELFSAPTQDAVNNWLDAHPEATTTVEDGAITEAKLNSSLSGDLIIFVSSLAELNTAMTNGEKLIAFKEGTEIEVSSMITIKSGTTIFGNGAEFVRKTGFEGKMINAEANCNISNIHFNGNRTAMVSPSWDTTIEISLNGFSTLKDCIFEHGNECVIAYGDCNRIEHCKFTDCGGNAIHFSGGKYTVVDGCYVSGANKRTGMGHENGCIIWSSECGFATCVNNYCEDALSGFGRIGSEHAGFVKIVCNTVKDCTYACEVGNTATGTVPAHEVIIANNLFINCTRINIYKSSNQTNDLSRVTITGNDLVNVAIVADRATNLLIANNNIRGDIAQISLNICSSVIVNGNIVNNTANMTRALLIYLCNNVEVIGNYIRGGKESILCNSSYGIKFDSNAISAYCTSTSEQGVSVPSNVTFRNNVLYSFGKGFNCGTGAMVINNQFWLANTAVAVNTYGGTSKCIVSHNMTNQSFTVGGTTDSAVGDNIAGVTADCFADVTMNLTNITSDAFSKVVLGDDFICNLTADSGYTLPDTITLSVNGITVPSTEYFYDSTSGKIEAYGVRGAVVVTATAS